METLVGSCRCALSWCDLDLTFDLAVVTLTFKSYPGYISETVRCRKLILGRDILVGVLGVQHHDVTLILPLTLLMGP